MGRPTKLSPAISRDICENLSSCMQRGDAAELAGISAATLAGWLTRGETGEEPYAEFRGAVLKAELLAQRGLLVTLSVGARRDLRAAQWLLERRYASSWSERGRGEALIPILPEAPGGQDPKALPEGLEARYPLLPWESSAEYERVLKRLLAEHSPHGSIEQHLVEELAWILLRKSRLHLREAASLRQGLERILSPHRDTVGAALAHVTDEEHPDWVVDAVQTSEDDTKKENEVFADVEEKARRALGIVCKARSDAYEASLAALQVETRKWWEDTLAKDPKGYPPDTTGLKRFLERQVLPWLSKRGQELWSRPLIREQAFGEAVNTDSFETLVRVEAYLDRKLERTLATLRQLQEQRRA
jgi:hypothetical protein